MKTRTEQLALVREASRAPSAHNTQPARWRFEPDGSVRVFEDLTRRLHVGDPEGRDSLIALGAALEGLHLALGAQSMAIRSVERASSASAPGASAQSEVAVATLGPGRADRLAPFVNQRRSYRGVFRDSASRIAAFAEATRDAGDVRVVTARADIDHAAELLDSCALEFMRDPRYQGELWNWMRLSPSDPRWHRDGLNADCLALNVVERSAARLLMRPRVFSVVRRLGMAGALVSESKQVRSAGALVVLHRPMAEDPFVIGRRFYRLWLELTTAGLSACPMSAITDSRTGRDEMRRRYAIPDDRRLINVFRVGVPASAPAVSARLPAEELLV